MFTRFRKTRNRLQVSLVATRRVAGKVTHEHVASLGSLPDSAPAFDRLVFWKGLHERLARLNNRIDAADIGKVMMAIHERVPMVTADEQRELKLKTAVEEERLAKSMLEMHEEAVSGQKGLIARAQASVSQGEAAMIGLTEDATEAAERVERLRSGEDAPGKISRPMTRDEFMKAIGWTEADASHAAVVQELYELGSMEKAIQSAIDPRLQQALYRKVLRERRIELGLKGRGK